VVSLSFDKLRMSGVSLVVSLSNHKLRVSGFFSSLLARIMLSRATTTERLQRART